MHSNDYEEVTDFEVCEDFDDFEFIKNIKI